MEIRYCLVAVYGENVMLVQPICKLSYQFKVGWESVDDKLCVGCPIVVHTDEKRHRVEKLILSNLQVTVTELKAATGLVRCQIRKFINKLGCQQICTRWVPKMLGEGHLIKRRASVLEFLTLCFCDPSIIR